MEKSIDILIKQAEDLRTNIIMHKKSIDNPALVMSTLSALNFFIENATEE